MYGGRSTEHDGSVATKEGAMELLREDIYQIVDLIYIDRDGTIFLNEMKTEISAVIDRIKNNKDVFYLNLMPGNEGEDGSWSGVFDICDGNGSFESVNTSSILMNKYQQCCIALSMLPKEVFCPDSVLVVRGNDSQTIDNIIDDFPSELLIKPNNMGSSHLIDTFMPAEKERIKEFLAKLFEYDSSALIQEFIEGDNYSCGVYGTKDNGTRALPVLYQKIGERYMSHNVKFGGEWDKVVVDDHLTKRIQELSVKIAGIFNIVGMCRFDFIVKNDKIYYLEGNLVPSLASTGSFNYMFKAAGIDFNDFIADIIYSFEQRQNNNKLLVYSA